MNLSHRVGSRFHTASLEASSSANNSFAEGSGEMSPGPSIPLRRAALFLAAISISCFVLYRAADSLSFSPPIFDLSSYLDNEEPKLEDVLSKAATRDRTVVLTTLNAAWAAPGSVIDLFFESFRIGEETSQILDHLVIVALDAKAYSRCLELHKHCFSLVTEGVDFSREAYFMTRSYLKMMWRRIDLLRSVLEMGYNFVFTDADVMWFRNPFPRFYMYADFQIACDHYLGRSNDLHNRPNGGFNFVRSNNRTILFYKYWYASRLRFPGYHDQDVLNFLKAEPFVFRIGLKMRFLNTAYFGGLCEPSRDLNLVRTMHANCCYGMESKLHDLRIMLQDWKDFMSLPLHLKQSSGFSWKVPQNCSLDSLRRYDESVEDDEESDPPGESQD
ncbi:putative nucleotide-diphospho-sugar transferase [Arabidopsis thaliana]|uniref:Nucleotide-diphospho-sugar transferase domain-containing protein n=2 Tax=Arabidopsis TaxID=3701 RepID=A0A178W395_ARATH|nr:Nucleotide-diphospho-sugar transferase [Arabidopsis thaliana x Arabidopsis arenosa]OAP12181.1 hypothetical protein AXX17_AT1G15200 [Arabidopsis thaliana]